MAISESWLSLEKGVDFEPEEYDFNFINRANKKGGGTALYVDGRLQFKINNCMTAAFDDVCESISLEIFMKKNKNIIVSYVYRAPSSSIEKFKEVMEGMSTNTEQKVTFICGVYNIDLLNPNKLLIDEYTVTMYSMSLYPIITKPSRIPSQSATIIDNIFTNNKEDNIISGLLMNDISDNLPLFVIYDCEHKMMKDENITRQNRVRTEDTLDALRRELLCQDWRAVYEAVDVNSAYDSLWIFLYHYMIEAVQ